MKQTKEQKAEERKATIIINRLVALAKKKGALISDEIISRPDKIK